MTLVQIRSQSRVRESLSEKESMDQRPYFYPLLLRPAYQHYLWGGQRLIELFHRPSGQGIIAESWELSDRKEGACTIETGVYQGMTLQALHRKLGIDLVGRVCERMPLLIKLIDAKLDLSVQVHPDEEAIKTLKGEAKTEAWIVLAKEKNARVYVGLKKEMSKGEFKRAMEGKEGIKLLQEIDVEVNDVIFVPAGTIHAIGAGCLMLEVQQNSNTTYRVFDFNRLDAEGKPRALHLEKAVSVAHLSPFLGAIRRPSKRCDHDDFKWESLLSCPYFCIDRLKIKRLSEKSQADQSFTYYFVTRGKGRLESEGGSCELEFGRSYLLPYQLKKWQIINEKELELIAVYLHPIDRNS